MTTAIRTLDELLVHADALEREAVERYEELADQMAVHNQPEVAELFRNMAAIEGQHVNKVTELAAGRELPRLAPWEYRWPTLEAPESVPVGQGHYRMNVRQALELMLACEERARDFFAEVVRDCPDPAARATAATLAADEQRHAQLLREWLTRYPELSTIWQVDLDEPTAQE